MRVTCHALEPGGGLRPEAELAAVAGWRAGGGPYWVDLSGDRPEEALGWLGGLGLDPAVLDALQIGDDSPRILPLAESVFLAYPVAAADDAGSAGRFPCLCLERLVVTLHPFSAEASGVAGLVAVAAMAVLVLAQTLRAGPVNAYRILGAVAAYLLLGLVWAEAYRLVALLTPGAFSASHPSGAAEHDFTYFSFVTLTTVGYGDATTVHPAARSLALTEALTGQLYPAILLARLVSLTTASPSSSPVAAGTGPKRGTP